MRVRPEVGQGPGAFNKQSKVVKNLRVLAQKEEPYRIDGDWVRLPREIMDALEYEGVNERYVKTQEFWIDFAECDDSAVSRMIYEV